MNFIIIVSDTLRRDHLGCYGNSWIHTPNLDRFAAALDAGRLPGGVLYRVKGAPDAGAVNRLMEKVRAYRAG